MNSDFEHLRLLSIFHYVVAGLAALFALIPVVHLVLGVAMVTGRLPGTSQPVDLRMFGWMFILIASTTIIAGLSYATCLVLAGRCLARHTHHTFCLVMAALACGFMAFGTVLGVFTILVLQRHSVKQLFGQAAPPASSSSGQDSQ